MESDHDGSDDIMGNGQMILGLEMAPKVFAIICGVKLGKPYVPPTFEQKLREEGRWHRG